MFRDFCERSLHDSWNASAGSPENGPRPLRPATPHHQPNMPSILTIYDLLSKKQASSPAAVRSGTAVAQGESSATEKFQKIR
jgi:hypothetical protein